MKFIKEYLERTKRQLDTISPQLIDEVNKIISGEWGLINHQDIDRVFLLDIEIFTDGFRLVLYPMTKELTQLGHKRLLEQYPGGLLSNKDLNPQTNLVDFDSEDEDSIRELEEFHSTRKDVFVNWFARCWNTIDNKRLNKPAYLMFHDTSKSLRLSDNKWINDEIKWA